MEALQKKASVIDQCEEAYKFALDKIERFSNNVQVKAKEPLLEKGYSILFDGAAVGTGSIVQFGRYETGNGIKPIKWRVLESSSSLLLITEQAIDCRKYNEECVSVTWETCTLRKWLNEEFISSAFNDMEQDYIKTSPVPAPKNPQHNTDPGSATEDRVFLLSIEEAVRYFKTDEDRRCKPTYYTVKQGGYRSGENCWWWLRSPGNDSSSAASVSLIGFVDYYGNYVINDYGAVRPALWINLGS